MTEALFHRDGTPAPTNRLIQGTTKRFYWKPGNCHRCGGLGGSDKWAHTGWTCYGCGGSGRGADQKVRVYTAERLVTLNKIADTKAEKRRVAAEAKLAQLQAEAEARREAFDAQYADVLPWLVKKVAQEAARDGYELDKYLRTDGFLPSLLRAARERAEWSEKQAEAIRASMARDVERDRLRAGSQHVGKVGERIECPVVVERTHTFYSIPPGGWREEASYIISLRDADGNALVAMGKFWAEKGTRFNMKATVKGHEEYRGEKQTRVYRVVDVEADKARRAEIKRAKAAEADWQRQTAAARAGEAA